MIAVNLSGMMYINRAAARPMIEKGSGSITNITSIDCIRAAGGNAAYCVSKAGAWMLTKCLALELMPLGVRVNAIGPGFIETRMSATFRDHPDLMAELLHEIPAGRMGQPEEIASTAAFLASDDASYITGSLFMPDGGIGAAYR
jgi:NAD(P)-dependent dehydrogenase (short-subunit alcohol dehydrogenase family)